MKKKYTHLFFDLDNTLWDFERNSRSAMRLTFEHFQFGNTKIDFDLFFKVYSKHNKNLWDSYRKKEVGKKEVIQRRFQNTFDDLGIKNAIPETINDFYLNEMPKQRFLIDGALDLLDYLKKRRYRLFIITNGFSEVQHNKLKSSGLYPYFDKIFISEEIKSPKPTREIFEHAIRSSNAKKIQSMMIGDDWGADVLGAINFGIDVVYFDKSLENKALSKVDVERYSGSFFNINYLHELKNML